MWSHYSAKHTGVVIGYDRKLIEEEGVIGGDVDYRWHPSKFRAGDLLRERDGLTSNRDYFSRKQLTKHPDWAYEQEYRLISLKHEGKSPIPREAIREVHFGCQMSNGTRDIVRGDVMKLGVEVNIFRMELRETWGLERRQAEI
jgi:hypothetical protein